MTFDTPSDEFGRPPQEVRGVDIAGKLVTWGFVSTKEQAQYVLAGVAAVVLIIAYLIYHSFTGGSSVPTTPVYSFIISNLA